MAVGGIFNFFGGWRPPTHPAFPAFRNSPPPTQPFAVTFQSTHPILSLNSLCGGGAAAAAAPPPSPARPPSLSNSPFRRYLSNAPYPVPQFALQPESLPNFLGFRPAHPAFKSISSINTNLVILLSNIGFLDFFFLLLLSCVGCRTNSSLFCWLHIHCHSCCLSFTLSLSLPLSFHMSCPSGRFSPFDFDFPRFSSLLFSSLLCFRRISG